MRIAKGLNKKNYRVLKDMAVEIVRFLICFLTQPDQLSTLAVIIESPSHLLAKLPTCSDLNFSDRGNDKASR